jgi:ethanolamine utilization protein EutS
MSEEKQRIIQEYVPGRQVTLAHVIASPRQELYLKLGLGKDAGGAIGIMTITPGEGVIIAADMATKAAAVEIGFLDRLGGSLLLTGDVASVDAAFTAVIAYFAATLQYATVAVTRS